MRIEPAVALAAVLCSLLQHGYEGYRIMDVTNYPLLVFVLSFLGLSLVMWIGNSWFKARAAQDGNTNEDFRIVEGTALTLLGLIIGFSFSMALNRYDQRKTFEEAEANAIGTEFVRADLLPAADGAKVRALLSEYLDQRIQFYSAGSGQDIQKDITETSRLQTALWAAVRTPAVAQPSPIVSLAVAGMNDVLNSQGYTQAAWWNRIPSAAWVLMWVIAVFANALVGMGMKKFKGRAMLPLVLPLIVSISLAFIAEIDNPQRGLIRVVPQNLVSLSESLRAEAATPP